MEHQEIEIKEVKKTPKQPTKEATKEASFVKLVDRRFTLEHALAIGEQKDIWDSKPENIRLAYNKIFDIWNKDQKSRNFIKHLCAAFLEPVDPFTRLFTVSKDDKGKIKCAIMGFDVIGIKDIAEAVAKFGMTKMMVDAKAYLEKSGEEKSAESTTEYSPEQLKTLMDARAEIPTEVKEVRIGYRSENSDKFLSQDAIIALHHFATRLIAMDNKEMLFTINKSRLKHTQSNFSGPKKLNKSQVNKLSKVGTYGIKENLDSATISALEKLKAQMDQDSE